MPAFRRVIGKYSTLEEFQQKIKNSTLYGELIGIIMVNLGLYWTIGCAFEQETKNVYVSLVVQKPLSIWKRLRFISEVTPWESREQIKTFALSNGMTFFPGAAYQYEKKNKSANDLETSVRVQLLEGDTLEEIENRLYLDGKFELLSNVLTQKVKLK